jgi:hypothetical protein
MHGALGHGAAEGGALRRWRKEEGDDSDERGPPVSEREDTSAKANYTNT